MGCMPHRTSVIYAPFAADLSVMRLPIPPRLRASTMVYSRYSRGVRMETKVQKWGNSLGVRIPRSLAMEAHLKPGTAVEISAEADAIVIRPVNRPRYSLAELLRGVTRANLHEELEFGGPMGREAL